MSTSFLLSVAASLIFDVEEMSEKVLPRHADTTTAENERREDRVKDLEGGGGESA